MKNVIEISKALSDENRLRAVMALRGGELCVCQIVELLGLAASTTSKHMSILHRAGLVQARKEGRWMYYRLSGRNSNTNVKKALSWVMDSVSGDRKVLKDEKTLKKICSLDRGELCRTQKTKR